MRKPRALCKLISMLGALLFVHACTPDQREQMICHNESASEAALIELRVLDEHGPVPSPALLERISGFLVDGAHQGWCHDKFRDTNIRLTGPILPVSRSPSMDPTEAADTNEATKVTAFGTHGRVRVYYSKQMVDWLQGDRTNPIPDGATMVKEMYPSPTSRGDNPTLHDGWAVMIRDSQASHDGWLWVLKYRLQNTPYTLPFQGGQYGNSFCLSCHAAAREQGTFADLGNLLEEDVATYIAVGDPGAQGRPAASHGKISTLGLDMAMTTGGEWNPNNCYAEDSMDTFYSCLLYVPLELPHPQPTNFAGLFSEVLNAPLQRAAYQPDFLPMDGIHDHVPPASSQSPGFVTASACSGCHDASDLVNGTLPEMSVPTAGDAFDHLVLVKNNSGMLALSPTAEWNGSLMSVSARDPIFRAQLESEVQKYPAEAAQTTELCLSCHAPMGARQHPQYASQLANTLATSYEHPAANAEFAALARDGVSCAVCHRIAAEGLGEPSTFNAKFALAEATEFFGPYADSVQQDPMHTALGAKPVHGKHISDSGLCGTCHMVAPPVYDNPAKDYAHEQTTYIEWRSSDYAQPGPTFSSCQDCHMRNTLPENDAALTSGKMTYGKIANYEDSTFPYVPNRKAADLTDTVERPGYARHTLLGLNLFTMNLFQQFPLLLGSQTFGPQRAFQEVVPPRALATYEVLKMARHQTANISLEGLARNGENLQVDVVVANQAGHKFPTGVGFRRAFIELKVTNQNGKVVWCSGCTDASGSLIDMQGQPLPAERPRTSNVYLPDFREITKPTEVQVYETRHLNNAGNLTTSFVELNKEVKDNRLLPAGWDASPFWDKFAIQPVAASLEARPERDRVSYRITGLPNEPLNIEAGLYYQALPPYYLLDRIALLAGSDAGAYPETERLLHLLSRMQIGGNAISSRAIADWKLLIDKPARLAVP